MTDVADLLYLVLLHT